MICRGATKLLSDHALSAGNDCRPYVILILRHRLPVGIQVYEVKRWFVCRVPSTETRPAPGAQRLCFFSGALPKPRPVPDTKR